MKRYRPSVMVALAVLVAACSADSMVGGNDAVDRPDSSVPAQPTYPPGEEHVAPSSAAKEPSDVTTSTTTTAVAGSTVGASTGRDPASSPEDQVVDQPAGDSVFGEVPTDLMGPVLADAAQRLGTSTFGVVRAEFVEWPDGSLGCPEPGVVYTMAITPGYWIEIQSGETVLDYRMTEAGYFTLCESPGLVPPPTGGNS